MAGLRFVIVLKNGIFLNAKSFVTGYFTPYAEDKTQYGLIIN